MPQLITAYIGGFFSPIAIVIFLSLKSDYNYHRESGHSKCRALKITIRRAFI
ncbi:hypothetical protein [Methylotenera oryzisoli]|uniref:hypothetical protein n=1 Tax=Methylotenera oryzisoli TaxID=2080758 RepID=UPI00143175A1|nr:hypothetical protein [Methylotenera oryzisoli]